MNDKLKAIFKYEVVKPILTCILFALIILSLYRLKHDNEELRNRIDTLEIKVNNAIDAINQQQLASMEIQPLDKNMTAMRRLEMVESQIQGLQFTMDRFGTKYIRTTTAIN